MKIIKMQDVEYPQNLLNIKNCPQKLYVEGDISLLNKPSIAMVGARKTSEYGKEMAIKFSKELSKNNICIVSGLAEGIDTYSHIGAKGEKGKTIAVLGSGIKNIYPKQNIMLAEEILEEGGLLVSEYEPNQEAKMEYFPVRNRIISGISIGTLVIEGRYRSGSSITAKYAREQEKEIFCLPGDIDRASSYLPNELIKNGAHIVTMPEDILEYYPVEQEKIINEDYKEVYQYIGNLPITVDELCRLTNISVSGINERLMMMEIEGLIKNELGGYIKVV